MDVYPGLHGMSLETPREDRHMYRKAGARWAVLAAMEATTTVTTGTLSTFIVHSTRGHVS